MSEIERVERRIHTIFHRKLQSGEMVPKLGMEFYANEGCGCLIGMVHPKLHGAMSPAAQKLGITEDEAHALERGFELRKPNSAVWFDLSDPYYKLGQRIRRHYT